ncbi:aminopeptidase P family protein [Kineosporia mesophila]|uniref:Xaa-Pro aminopeptidase n=1 Tax=Kineosporia mesophila TaxID=566012 RepID=A0ABP6YVZ2_9ACTN|nr:aminopeptidase P family protein [Kineosporia mesophila]MCD5351697.1 aminopeptidase P family protein [Kineosporia mesophila]
MSENEPVVQGPEGESAQPAEVEHRERPNSPAFRKFIASGWAPRPEGLPEQTPAAPYAAARRAALAAELPGERLVLPAGGFRVRSNDTDYRFRPHSAFAHLTGLGTDREPDAALVLEPSGDGFDAVLYFQPRAERDSEQFYANPRYGELWVGVRPSLEEVAAETGLICRPLDELADAVTKDAGAISVRVVRDADPALDEAIDEARAAAGTSQEVALAADRDLARIVSELRLVKDDFEIAEMRRAIDVTARGFADIVRALPEAVASVRGERVVETVFESRARREGNGVGYDTIAASGPHACTLHWIRNDGPVNESDLVLVDAGAEVDSLYTADITRTLPVSGTFTDAQRRVYQAVLDAADAAFAAARPGVKFREVHSAAMQVIAARLEEWNLLPSTAQESLQKENQFHRRWMVHGTSHHLGIDVHDCAQARKEMYLDAELEPGMIFTIEPGLYFGPHDLLAPEEFRGIGVRIEDDVLVTADGVENLSAGLPREPAQIEAWMASLHA